MTTSGRLAGNNLTPDKLRPYSAATGSAAANKLAASGREDTSYHFENRGTAYQAINKRHGFAAAFSQRGVVITAGQDEWRLAFLGCGDGNARGIRSNVAPMVSANRVEYRRGALTEWYVNGPLGLEQGFTVHEPPAAGATELSLRLKMGGSLAAVTDGDGRGLVLRPADGSASYRFGGLVAFDASGRSLEPRMSVRGDELIYTVDVAGARYPVVIDPQFTGGPSVRVTPNVRVEFKWITDVTWFGKVEVFDNATGSGSPILTRRSEDALGNPVAATQHTVTADVVPPLAPSTSYFFKVTSTNPTDPNDTFSSPIPLPPFFTGAQALSNVRAEAITSTGATIAWDANVIGFGSVSYGTAGPTQGPVEDRNNIPNHAIALTGLSPGTTYTFEASNKHAIDGDKLAMATSQFTTPAEVAEVVLTQPDASPRTIDINESSAVSVVAKYGGNPVPGIVVTFSIDPESQGNGTFGGSPTTQATTDANGRATAQLTATARGNVFVNASSSSARTSPKIVVVVRHN